MSTIHIRLSSFVTNGRSEILFRFVGGKTVSMRAKSRLFCPVAAFDADSECVIVPAKKCPETAELRALDIRLQELVHIIYSRWEDERFDADCDWLQRVVDETQGIITHPVVERMTLAEVVRACAHTKPLAPATIRQFEVVADALDRFAARGHKIFSDRVTGEDMYRFEEFFQEERHGGTIIRRGGNTVVTKMRRIRSACNWAVEQGLMKDSPFGSGYGKYKMGSELYGDPTFMTLEERDSLYLFDGLTPTEAVQRDIFVFQCHVGCRVSDLVALTKDNVSDGFLQYIARKTIRSKALVVRVPLSAIALEIIERYAGQPDGRLLPFIHPNKFDAIIHRIMQKAGLDRVVLVLNPQTRNEESKRLYEVGSSHLARRTFIQHIFEETESEVITSSFTGHVPGSKSFRRYARATDKMKKDIIDRVNG